MPGNTFVPDGHAVSGQQAGWAQRVHAWILWEDGTEELVQAHAIAWTKRAVRVRFGAPPHQDEVWVWA